MKLFRKAVLWFYFFQFGLPLAILAQENLPGQENKGANYKKHELKKLAYWQKKLEFTPEQKLIMGKAHANTDLTIIERKQALKLLKREKRAKAGIKAVYSNHYYEIQDRATKKRIKETRKRAERNNKRKPPVKFLKLKRTIKNIFN